MAVTCEASSLRDYRKAVVDVFTSYYAKLSSATEGCITQLAEKAFEAKLISNQVMKEKNFTSIYNDFKTGLELRTSVSEIKRHCKCFIEILEDLGGPAAIVSSDVMAKLFREATKAGM